jgi:3-oxoacid CoA-transferase subunit A
MATAARVTIVEAEELVEPGKLDPDRVHVPSVYVKRVFLTSMKEKRIEKRTVRKMAAGIQ